MSTPDEIRKQNIQESNLALGEAINLTARLADVMSDVVKNTKNKGELDKGSLDLAKQAVKVTRDLSSEYSSINDVQKDMAKNQKKQQDIQKQIAAITKNLTDKEKSSLETFRKKSSELNKAKSIEQSLIEKQKQGKNVTDDQIKRAQELVAQKEEQVALSGQNLSSQAEQIAALEAQGQNLELNNEYLAEQLRRQENIRKGMGAFGRAAEGAQKTLEKIGFGEIGKALGLDAAAKKAEELSKELTKGGKESVTGFGKLKILFGSLGAALKSALGPIAIVTMIVSSFKKGEVEAKKLNQQTVDISRNLGISQKEAAGLASQARSIGASMGITSDAATKSAESIYSALGGVTQLSQETLNTFMRLNVFAGMSAESIAGMYKFSKLSGESAEATAEAMATTAQESIKSMKVNISQKAVMEGVSKVSNTMKLNFKGSAAELTKAFVQSKKLGLELGKVEDVANSLLNIEDSIAAEMEAELLTGKELNLEKAREAALNNDTATLMEEIANQFGSIEDFQKMNRVQQEAFAKSIGMSRDGLADMLVSSKENAAENTDLLDTQKAGLAAMQSMASTAEKLAAAEEARNQQSVGIFDALSPLVELFEEIKTQAVELIKPIVEQLVPVIKDLGETLLPIIADLFTSLKPAITAILEALKPVLVVFVEVAKQLLPIIFEIIQTLIPPIIQIVEAFAPLIQMAADLALQLLPPIVELFNALLPAFAPLFELVATLVKALMPTLIELFKMIEPILKPVIAIITGIAETITGILNGDWDKVGEGLKKIGVGILNLVISMIEGAINLIIMGANTLIKGITFGAVSNAIPKVSLPRVELAEGGVVTKPTNALIGEAGPEAVVPLNSDKSLNVNTKALEEKLDRLISLVERGGIVTIDGQKVGQALVLGSYQTQ